jgi:putative proteasome-type protease
MTYCLATISDQGLVFASDSRTNAGVDQLSTFSKCFIFGIDGQSVFVLLTAGNLATTQAVISKINRDIAEGASPNLYSADHISEAAEYIGSLSLEQQHKGRGTPVGSGVDTSASFIFGGQIRGGDPAIYLIYPEGNFIAATEGTPYLQIGEVKYGKPILDRIINRRTGLEESALCAMVSMDSTMRSNATVGPPIEVFIYEKDSFSTRHHFVFKAEDPYLTDIRQAWDSKIKEAFSELHPYDWGTGIQQSLID